MGVDVVNSVVWGRVAGGAVLSLVLSLSVGSAGRGLVRGGMILPRSESL